jgi:hypothetical protein
LAEKLGKDLGHGEEISRHLGLLQGASELGLVQKVALSACMSLKHNDSALDHIYYIHDMYGPFAFFLSF